MYRWTVTFKDGSFVGFTSVAAMLAPFNGALGPIGDVQGLWWRFPLESLRMVCVEPVSASQPETTVEGK